MVLRLRHRDQFTLCSAPVQVTSISRAASTWWLWTATLVGRLSNNQSRDGSLGSSRTFRHIQHSRQNIFRWWTWIYSRGDTATVINLGCAQLLSSVMLAHSNGRSESRPASACLWRTLARTARITSTIFKEPASILQQPWPWYWFVPTQMFFGRPLNDFILILPGSYEPHNTWIETSQATEEAMRARTVGNG